MNVDRDKVAAHIARSIEMSLAAYLLGDTWPHIIGIFFALSAVAPFIPRWAYKKDDVQR